ncbi:hypothetical protein MRB53_001185 [Persea americana]|uniref:Uncharacterized protein n=1 Tax=Persea americana TaxID=3435 RepID=A0ACC2MQW9_PERAE|nr:hypothetical protein MRB53_001185 [Persea americana]
MLAKLSQPMKQRIADEVLERLEGLTNANADKPRLSFKDSFFLTLRNMARPLCSGFANIGYSVPNTVEYSDLAT